MEYFTNQLVKRLSEARMLRQVTKRGRGGRSADLAIPMREFAQTPCLRTGKKT